MVTLHLNICWLLQNKLGDLLRQWLRQWSACNAADLVQSLGWDDTLEKEMATDSSIFDWKIPWMKEPGRLLAGSVWSESDTTEHADMLYK